MSPQGKQPKAGEKFSPEWYAQMEQKAKQDREQVELARKRMGADAPRILRWVVDFAQSDLGLLRPEERQAKGYDLRALPYLVRRPRAEGQKALFGITGGWTHPIGPMSDATVKAIHSGIALGLRKLFGGGSPDDPGLPSLWELPKPKAWLYRSSPDGAARTHFGIMWETTQQEEEGILAAAVNLILEAGGKLRACPKCGRVFLSERRQVFCSTGHAQQARNEKRYALKLEAEAGPGVAKRYRKAKSGATKRKTGRAATKDRT